MVKIVFDSCITKLLGLDGLVLYPYVLVSSKKEDTSNIVLKHELTHVMQIERDGVFNFYMSYVRQLIDVRQLIGCNFHNAYMNNEYEKEAYKNETKKFTKNEKILLKSYGIN